jgi:hypothetical protein
LDQEIKTKDWQRIDLSPKFTIIYPHPSGGPKSFPVHPPEGIFTPQQQQKPIGRAKLLCWCFMIMNRTGMLLLTIAAGTVMGWALGGHWLGLSITIFAPQLLC